MKVAKSILLAFSVLQNASVSTVHGFTVAPKTPVSRNSAVNLASSSLSTDTEPTPSSSDEPMFPLHIPMETIQGGETVRTYQMPKWAERVQMIFQTNGRPLKATVELWTGPIRRTHYMKMDLEDGRETPFRATLKFKKGPQVLKVMTSKTLELPVQAGVAAPSAERSEELGKISDKVWESSDTTKQRIQGGSTEGGPGSVRTFPIATETNAIQVMFWSKDVGKKSLKCKIELLQGPNNKKQVYDLQCGGGSQPYHAIFETPGPGWQIRLVNNKFVEDGLFQFAVVPYDLKDASGANRGGDGRSKSEWWE